MYNIFTTNVTIWKKKKTIGEQPTIQPTCMSSVEGEMLTDFNLRK